MTTGGDRSGNLPLIRETLAGVVSAIDDEIHASLGEPSSQFLLRDGRLIARSGANHLWSFEFDGELPLGPESSGQLLIDGRDPITAVVLAVGDLDLVLSVRDELGESLRSVILVAQPLFILESLQRRLSDAVEQLLDASILEQVLDLVELPEPEDDDDEPHPSAEVDEEDLTPTGEDDPTDPGLSYEQLLAAEHATQEGLRFVWGPPGTGKTATLAATVAALAAAGGRVMVVAHSNAAVDVAMVRIAGFMKGTSLLDNDQVLRVGPPQLAEARDCHPILPDEIIARRFPELGVERRRLEAERRRLSGQMRVGEQPSKTLALQLDEVRAGLADIDHQLEDGQSQLIRDARVVGCTLAKVTVNAQMWNWERDALIIDEASMAGLPFVMALAARAPRTLACFGDFRQLPPIAISDRASAKAWFGRDVFELAGVVTRVENGEADPRLAILRTQYRMGETIAAAVSDVAYYSLLASDVSAIERAHAIAERSPLAGEEVAIIDVSTLHPQCQQDAAPGSFTRFNLRTAGLVAVLAQQAKAAGLDVGVISPYRGQVAVLASLLRSSGITAATMHRFQGSERDAIVLDLVDTHPATGPSMLTGKDADLALRLLNVGISRAKGKLIIVVDLPFLRASSPKDSPALAFIDEFIELGATMVDGSSLVPGLQSGSVQWMPDWWAAVRALAGTGAATATRVGLNDRAFATAGLADELRAVAAASSRTTLHAPIEIARGMEASGAEIRLRPFAHGQMAVCDGKGVVVGGEQPDQPAAVLKGAGVTNTVRRLLLREA